MSNTHSISACFRSKLPCIWTSFVSSSAVLFILHIPSGVPSSEQRSFKSHPNRLSTQAIRYNRSLSSGKMPDSCILLVTSDTTYLPLSWDPRTKHIIYSYDHGPGARHLGSKYHHCVSLVQYFGLDVFLASFANQTVRSDIPLHTNSDLQESWCSTRCIAYKLLRTCSSTHSYLGPLCEEKFCQGNHPCIENT